MTSVDVIYAAHMEPGTVFAGLINPDAPTRPVQTWVRAHTLTAVTPFDADDGRRMLRLQAGPFALTPVRAAAQVLVITEHEPRPGQHHRDPATGDPLDTWTVESEGGQREWRAADVDHALEQHRDAFPAEAVLGAWLGTKAGETLAGEWTRHGEPLPGTPGDEMPQDIPIAAANFPKEAAAGDTGQADTDRLTELAYSLGAGWWELSEFVHDMAVNEAGDANNSGMDAQVAYLIRAAGPAAAERMIREAAQETNQPGADAAQPGTHPRYLAHFSPEAWVNDQAIPVDPAGPQEWDCTDYAARNRDYLDRLEAHSEPLDSPQGAADNDDVFKHDPAAPQWVREWHGPCTIRITRQKPAKFDVEVTRSITTTVSVESDSADAAWSTVNRRDYQLPPRDEWTGSKDWAFVVYDQAGRELGRDDGDGYYPDTTEPAPDHEPGADKREGNALQAGEEANARHAG